MLNLVLLFNSPQVLLVALVSCCCHTIGALFYGFMLMGIEESVNMTEFLYWFEITIVLNSSVNLFIYVIVSKNFRRVLVSIFAAEQFVLRPGKTQSEIRMEQYLDGN